MTLERFVVWDRLVVGPVRVEPRRLVMPYRVEAGGEAHETVLIYRYGERVFGRDLASENLASMIGAQVALNYGPFCNELVFHGPFDRHDRALLRAMAENTAREIAVNKLFGDNPFLDTVAPERRARYLAARVLFPDSVPEVAEPAWGAGGRVAVLSSGGKESLLTLGLVEEIGREAHCLFVAESGSHWNTARNGFRDLSATRPHTARVWTSSDRVFAWALRLLPFVRPDFARVRADMYPVRLWTVAVFAFGVLPLMRTRRIGVLAVGDEYDTTVRVRDHGIPHYAGLYDQSRWFDEALSRYYARKGWGVRQLSLLRPASELLVQRALAERYPALFASQVSCHAARPHGERVLPCGKCEKCRRVVGMLVAIGADPRRIGYTAISEALDALGRHPPHQEDAVAEQVAWMLLQRGAIPADSPLAQRARPRPEALKLRFHPVASPWHTAPPDLMAPVVGLLLDHADGAVVRDGERWRPLGNGSAPVELSP